MESSCKEKTGCCGFEGIRSSLFAPRLNLLFYLEGSV